MLAWTEAELARKEDLVDRAEASGWPAEPFARAGFLEKTLAAMARARC